MGGISPVKSLPQWLQHVTWFPSLRHDLSFSNAVLLRGAGLETVWPELYLVAGLSTGVLIAALVICRRAMAATRWATLHRDAMQEGALLGLELLILGIVVGSNNFATSLALGSLGQDDRRLRILVVFAAFEFGVPLLGLALGRRISGQLADNATWLGPLLIAGLGLWTLLVSTRRTPDTRKLARWLSSWRGLFALSAGLSLDNLVVGFGLGLGGMPVVLTATVIMLCSVAFAWIGLRIGAIGRRNFETPAEAFSGLLLLGVAWMILAGVL